MDLILTYPPHLIALACIYVASVLKDKENTAWFEELRVDMNVVSLQKLNLLHVMVLLSLIICLSKSELSSRLLWALFSFALESKQENLFPSIIHTLNLWY